MFDLHCVDSYEFIKTIPDNSVDLILTDPPYEFNPNNNGWKQAGGMITERKVYKEIGTKLGSDKKLDCGITADFLENLKRVFRKGYNAVFFCNQFQLKMYMDFAERNDYRYNILVWCKTNPTPLCNNKYLDDLEFQIQIKSSDYKIGGDYGTKSKWFMSSVNKVDKELYNHPTIKPLELVEKFIINHSYENDVVFDPFMGSGTTGVACKLHNRNFIGCEINPEYFKICEERINGTSVKKHNNTLF